MTPPPTQDEILRKSMFGHKWSEGNQSHLLKAKAAIVSWALRIVAEARPGKKTKDPSGYANEANLRAWQDGYNKALIDYATALKQRLEKEKA